MSIAMYILECMEERNQAELLELGFSKGDISMLSDLSVRDLMRLFNRSRDFIRINRQRLRWTLKGVQRQIERKNDTLRLIRAGAPYSMMRSLCRISKREFVILRRQYKILSPPGRPSLPSDRAHTLLGRYLQDLVAGKSQCKAEEFLELQRVTHEPLASLWQAYLRLLRELSGTPEQQYPAPGGALACQPSAKVSDPC